MGKSQPVHRSGHLNIGEQHMDPNGMLLESIQSSLSMPDFHYLDALVSKRLGDQKRTSSSSSATRTRISSGMPFRSDRAETAYVALGCLPLDSGISGVGVIRTETSIEPAADPATADRQLVSVSRVGKRMTNVVPSLADDRTSMFPPCAAMISLQM
jgi:hypothetical protein